MWHYFSISKNILKSKVFDFSLENEDMEEIRGLNENFRNYGVEM